MGFVIWPITTNGVEASNTNYNSMQLKSNSASHTNPLLLCFIKCNQVSEFAVTNCVSIYIYMDPSAQTWTLFQIGGNFDFYIIHVDPTFCVVTLASTFVASTFAAFVASKL